MISCNEAVTGSLSLRLTHLYNLLISVGLYYTAKQVIAVTATSQAARNDRLPGQPKNTKVFVLFMRFVVNKYILSRNLALSLQISYFYTSAF